MQVSQLFRQFRARIRNRLPQKGIRHLAVRWIALALITWILLDGLLAVVVHLYGQQGQVQSADVMIVLGSGLNRDGSAGDALTRRSVRAAELWQQGYASAIICTGGYTQGYRWSEASGCKAVLMQAGVPEASIWMEEASRSTEENVIYSSAIMQAQGWQTALVISDPFHLLRANWILNDYGIEHTMVPATLSLQKIGFGWYLAQLAREVIALQWQAFKNLLHLPVTSVPVG